MIKIWEILKRKSVIWILLSLPMIGVLARAFTYPLNSFKFFSLSLEVCGFTAVSLLGIVLSLNPLVKLIPQAALFNVLNRNRRAIGLGSFYYAFFHACSYFLKKFLKTGEWPWIHLLHPIVIFGLLAFLLLAILAATSNDFSIKKLGFTEWKNIHRASYAIEAMVFIHLVLQRGTPRLVGLFLFAPLVLMQLMRCRRAGDS